VQDRANVQIAECNHVVHTALLGAGRVHLPDVGGVDVDDLHKLGKKKVNAW